MPTQIIPLSSLPAAAQKECRCNGHPAKLRIKKAARCEDCNGWIYPISCHIPDYAAGIANLELSGLLHPSRRPSYVVTNDHYRADPIEKTNFSRKYRQSRVRLGIEVELSVDMGQVTQTDSYARKTHADHVLTAVYGTLNSAYAATKKQEASAYCIMKHDGSVPGRGAEFSCIPATVDTHVRCWSLVEFSDFTDTAKCGLHVHIDRRDMSPLLCGKFSLFWNIVAVHNLQHEVFRREFTDYCEPGPTVGIQVPYQRAGWRDRRGTQSGRYNRHVVGRYPETNARRYFQRTQAVSHRRKTVELRLPRSPHRAVDLHRALSCIECSIEFLRFYSIASICNPRAKDMWRDFEAFADFNSSLPDTDPDKSLGDWRAYAD